MLSPGAQKVQDAIRALGFSHQVVELPQSTRSASEAAKAIGCKVGQIAKSLVFKGEKTSKPILIIASGANRVDEKKVEKFVLEPVKKADPDFVLQETGFVIGGIPPVGHSKKLRTFIDEDLMQHGEIWAAAGTPRAVFKLPPQDLVKMTRGEVIPVK